MTLKPLFKILGIFKILKSGCNQKLYFMQRIYGELQKSLDTPPPQKYDTTEKERKSSKWFQS